MRTGAAWLLIPHQVLFAHGAAATCVKLARPPPCGVASVEQEGVRASTFHVETLEAADALDSYWLSSDS